MNAELFTLVSNIITFATSGGLAAVLVMKYQRRKVKAESEGVILDNIAKAVKVWRDLSQEHENRALELEQRISILEKRLDENECLVKGCENRKQR